MTEKLNKEEQGTLDLLVHNKIIVRQRHELGELIGIETRNKYEILDQNQNALGFAAEQQKGVLGILLRQFLGHWRSFNIFIFNNLKQIEIKAYHPFRFYFERLEITDNNNRPLGAIQRKFSIFSKRFDVEDNRSKVIMSVNSPIWRIWTFVFKRKDKELATIRKKWSGILSETFTDKDNFLVEYNSSLNEDERKLVLAAALFVDIRYFESKASN